MLPETYTLERKFTQSNYDRPMSMMIDLSREINGNNRLPLLIHSWFDIQHDLTTQFGVKLFGLGYLIKAQFLQESALLQIRNLNHLPAGFRGINYSINKQDNAFTITDHQVRSPGNFLSAQQSANALTSILREGLKLI